MDHLHSTTTEHRKGQHLTFEHRVLIQTRLKDGWSPARIAQEIGCAPNTVRNEIKRGTVALYIKEISCVTRPLPGRMLTNIIVSHAAGTMTSSRKLTLSLLWSRSSSKRGGRWMLVSAALWKMDYSPEIRSSVLKPFMVTPILAFWESRTSIFQRSFAGRQRRLETGKTNGFLAGASRNVLHPQMIAASSDTGKRISSSDRKVITMTPC